MLGSAQTDVIDARTLNLTLGSGFAAFLTSAIVVFNDSFKAIFGGDALTGPELADAKIRVLVPVVAAFAAIAVADLLARAWTTAASKNAKATEAAAREHAVVARTVATQSYVLAAAPPGLVATRIKGRDEAGFIVGALRFKPSAPDAVEYLVVKSGVAQEWVAGQHLELSAGVGVGAQPAASEKPTPAGGDDSCETEEGQDRLPIEADDGYYDVGSDHVVDRGLVERVECAGECSLQGLVACNLLDARARRGR